jgi:hypothetical protein
MKAVFSALLIPGAALLALAPAFGQDSGTIEKVGHVTVYGRDRCPPQTGDDIVICVRKPETERYRIPEPLREPSGNPENESWAVRAESVEYVGRTGTQSCSTVGPGGFTGCWEQMMRAAREERRRGTAAPAR